MALLGAYHRLMRLNGAQALEDHIAAFAATQWIMDGHWRSRESVNGELAAVHKLTEAALVRAVDAWNERHHALRKLPLELFELCWSFLDTPGLLLVASTCKVWRRMIHNAPTLWASLTFPGVLECSPLGPLLTWSRDALFDISVRLKGSSKLSELGTVLRPHAPRLRRLELHSRQGVLQHGPAFPLQFSAPALRTFICDIPGLSFQGDRFKLDCPNLEYMKVGSLALDRLSPHVCFRRVTSLTCCWDGCVLSGLYDAFPSLVNLDITFREHL